MAGKNSKPNIFEFENMMKDSTVDRFMKATEKRNEDFETLDMMDAMLQDKDLTMIDCHGCEYFFLRTFPTPEMLEDFPVIASDFLKHEAANLEQYDTEEYLTENDYMDRPSSEYIKWILNMMLNAAKQGNGYAVGLFQNLYQTYYKREYKTLKRFRRITRDELVAVSNDGYDSEMMGNVARILIMCRLFGIEICSDCYIFFYIFQRAADDLENNRDVAFFDGFPKEIVESSMEYVEAELTKAGPDYYHPKNKALAAFHEEERFIGKALNWLNLPEDMVDLEDEELCGYDEWLIRALELMKQSNPQKEYSFEEVQQKAALLHVLCALGCYHDRTTENIQRMFGINQDYFEWDNKHCLFDPSKTKIPTGFQYELKTSAHPEEKHVNGNNQVSDCGTESLRKELEQLRIQLRKQGQENAHLKAGNQHLANKLDEMTAAQEVQTAEHEELLHLRNFVSRMTESEGNSENSDRISDMENALKDKKVIIIGGHSNWTYKLRNRFRKWVFLKPEVNNTLESRVLDGADYIYFFTDTISHGTYGKYMREIRTRNIINYGYIHSINIDSNIQQIYADIFGDEEADSET